MAKKKRKGFSRGLPELFLERLEMMMESGWYKEVLKTFVERPTTFRLNTIRIPKQDHVQTALAGQGFKFKKIPWYADAFILENKKKRDLTETQEYLDGKLYIQSFASMVPSLVLEPKPGETVLDLTAAPGSKTSQIAMMMERRGELVANDKNKVRFFKLKHNMELLGVFGDEVGGTACEESLPGHPVQVDERWFFRLRMEHGAKLCKEYPEYFDKILLDAPCSAEARFVDGQPKTYGYWSERKIKEMAYTQRQLLLSAWQALKPGGLLVYSTCTFAPEENEVQVARLLDRYPDEAHIEPIVLSGVKRLPPVLVWKGRELNPAVKHSLRILPTKEMEGFFVAKIRKSI